MTAAALVQRPRRAIERLFAALTDPARRERAMAATLAAYTVVWTVYGTIAKGSQGLHYDMTEVIAWSRDLSLGYLKHPPLSAWLARLWFSVFPLAEWSYYLLAMLMPAIALWIVWRIAADYLDGTKRVAAVALLTLVPFFNFHALKYNVNTVLLPLWAAATLLFLRSYRTHGSGAAALAGVAAAAAMLGKYWSAVLLLGLGIAALTDRRRAAYFRSPAPWITIAVGILALVPHLVWLWQHDFAAFAYATAIHGEKPFAATAVAALGYLGGAFGYVAVPVIIVLTMTPWKPAALAEIVWPADPDRRLAAVAFWVPLLLPVLLAPVAGIEITSLWSGSAFTLLTIVLLSSPAVTVGTREAQRILALALAVPFLALIAAPLMAIAVLWSGPPPAAAHGRLLADQIESAWHQATPQPLRFVDGYAELAYAVAAYAVDRPRALPGLPQPSGAELARDGWVVVCFAEDSGCQSAAAAQAALLGPIRVMRTEIRRRFLGLEGRPQRYAVTIVPPQESERGGAR